MNELLDELQSEELIGTGEVPARLEITPELDGLERVSVAREMDAESLGIPGEF